MMDGAQNHSSYAKLGIALGGIALLLALVHFWAGPFAPQPTLESFVADKVTDIRDATIAAANGERSQSSFSNNRDLDDYTRIATAVMGGLALILAIIGLANKEPRRSAMGAAALGISAIVFQFVAMYAMALLVVLIICAVVSRFGFDL